MIGLVYSIRDPAGRGIAKHITESLNLHAVEKPGIPEYFEGNGFVLAGFEEDVIYFDFLEEKIPFASEYIVLSRHSSEAGVKSYTVHHTGNYGREALYGGKPMELGVASPVTAWRLLRLVKTHRDSYGRGEYYVGYEATHHGPTSLSKPVVFVEIGSTLDEWSDPVNHKVIGDAVMGFLLGWIKDDCRPVAGIGGGHYPRKHSEIALTQPVCYGHIMAKYSLENLSKQILKSMVERSIVKPEALVVEKKGTRLEHRALIEEFAAERGLQVEYI
ncbi:MAG: D-aminoacyl-tRNA deacylase [Desulfurococcus sp.]|nr:D-aminoacyl-tRNA deacylase [Desulfurococcus sp.]